MCACTESVRTFIGAVCVEYGRPTWPITMLNHTSLEQKNVFIIYFWHPTHARTTLYEEAFLPEGQKRPRYKPNQTSKNRSTVLFSL